MDEAKDHQITAHIRQGLPLGTETFRGSLGGSMLRSSFYAKVGCWAAAGEGGRASCMWRRHPVKLGHCAYGIARLFSSPVPVLHSSLPKAGSLIREKQKVSCLQEAMLHGRLRTCLRCRMTRRLGQRTSWCAPSHPSVAACFYQEHAGAKQ